ncbi:hypothetical protein RDI58_002551 [Solanum bulbocastanum]|uniref:DNA/RNA-binding protein Alba-like domain-containing protein n=1 Tax=Solanum bulbocastanum TaxID=147425 RepID=A0AAN8YU89_SOLBU
MPVETMTPVAAPTPATATPASTPTSALAPTNNKNNEAQKKSNRIQVSNTKKPLFFYVNLAKRYMQQHNEVELSALGMAITTVVTVAEILKNGGFATEKKVLTSTVEMKDEAKGRMVQKARIEIMLTKSEKFDKLMTPNTNSDRAVAQDGAATNKNTITSNTKEQNKK